MSLVRSCDTFVSLDLLWTWCDAGYLRNNYVTVHI